jgi:hypothetical protein
MTILDEYRDVLLPALQSTIPDLDAVIGGLAGLERAPEKVFDFKLMPAKQVLEVRQQLRDESDFFDRLLFVMADPGGNFGGPWVNGKLSGRWSFHFADEPDLTVRFRSSASLRQALDAAGLDVGGERRSLLELPADFPDLERRASDDEKAADRAIVDVYWKNLPQQEESIWKQFFAFNILALTPPEDAASLVQLLDSDDMWVRERAIVTLGELGFEPARERIAAFVGANGNEGLAAPAALAALDRAKAASR